METAKRVLMGTLTEVEWATYTGILVRRIEEAGRNREILVDGKITSAAMDKIIAQTDEEFTGFMNLQGKLALEDIGGAAEFLLRERLEKSYMDVKLARDCKGYPLKDATHARVHSGFDFFGLDAEVITYTLDPFDTESEQDVAEFNRLLRLSAGKWNAEHILFSF